MSFSRGLSGHTDDVGWTAHGRFTRAIQNVNVWQAEMAAREMGGLSLDDALSLCALSAGREPNRHEAAGPALAPEMSGRGPSPTFPLARRQSDADVVELEARPERVIGCLGDHDWPDPRPIALAGSNNLRYRLDDLPRPLRRNPHPRRGAR